MLPNPAQVLSLQEMKTKNLRNIVATPCVITEKLVSRIFRERVVARTKPSPQLYKIFLTLTHGTGNGMVFIKIHIKIN